MVQPLLKLAVPFQKLRQRQSSFRQAKAEREGEAREVLEGHLRSILGSMTVEEIYKNRDKFSQEVQRVASQDLAKMGLVIVSFTIKDVRDKMAI